MCGIFGYIGKKQARDFLLEGLQRMEYRGYDSAGLAVKSQKSVNCCKNVGKVSLLKALVEKQNIEGTIGIAHTRWATHGEPNLANAHPHSCCKNKIFIVHNGIIENSDALKKYLEEKGHKFISDTDSEVLAHLIEDFLKENSFENAVKKSLNLVEGTYGLLVLSNEEEKLICSRKGSPLIIGYGKGEYFVASDIAAIAQFTKEYYALNNEDLCTLTREAVAVENHEKAINNLRLEKINWSIKEIEKAGYDHFMLKEIFEQPKALQNCLRGRLKKEGVKISIEKDNINLNQLKRIIIIGCGTSWHAGLIAKTFMEKILNIPVSVEYASEFRYSDAVFYDSDLFIAISQSGETADTLEAIKKAKQKAKTLGIINVVGSTISREVDAGIYIHAGPEIGVASTKAFTGQILSLMLLTLRIAKVTQKLDEKCYNEFFLEIGRIPEKIDIMLKNSFVSSIKETAKEFYKAANFLFLGRGINFPTALEGALKLKEISYIHAEGYPAAEMKHGPIALIDQNMPVVFIASKNGTYEKILSNMQEVKARKGMIISIASEKDPVLEKLSDKVIYVPETIECLSPILNIIPLQLLAYYIAVFKGLDPDKPRNLAKSVTVE